MTPDKGRKNALDPSKLDELAELADGDLEFVADLLETYLG